MDRLKFLKRLIEIKSFDTNNNKEIVDFLVESFKPYAKEIKRLKNFNDSRENLLIGLNTKLKNISDAVVLSGHIDTVVADVLKYDTNPYKATEKDGKVFGLGSIDMKSFFACILNNIEQLSTQKPPIVIAITGDEETTFEGVDVLTAEMQRLNIVPKLTIVGEPTSLKVCTLSKSCFEYQVDITGKGCHSSAPQNGINANYVAARIMLFIEKLCKKQKDTTLTSNVVCGGEKVNIISAFASLKFDIRSESQKSADKVLFKIERYLIKLIKKYGAQIVLKQNLKIPALEDNKSSLIEGLVSKFGLETTEFKGGCEAGCYQALGGDAMVFGVGDLSLAHKPNEYVEIKDFKKYEQLLLDIISIV